jgi:hypothetical protein
MIFQIVSAKNAVLLDEKNIDIHKDDYKIYLLSGVSNSNGNLSFLIRIKIYLPKTASMFNNFWFWNTIHLYFNLH